MTSANESLNPEDWKNIARKDWHRIFVLLDDGDADGAAIFIQQSVEKYLKAFLLQNGWKLRKIHDLVSLLDSAVDFKPALETFRDLCERVTAYYFVERYPPFISSDLTVQDIEKDKSEAIQMIKAMFENEELS
ncbi:MAG: HEPN domain-containing protein [Nitrospirae bacterium]|nr:HEPN domain-containing protein [Nitrospirota bacterium]MCL5978782.1 HEPN domain-containing protein [Nitrospirota bacterium]